MRCPQCGFMPLSLARPVPLWMSAWIDQQVFVKERLHREGLMGTRKQDNKRTNSEIDREGLTAELFACLVLCPGFLHVWKDLAASAEGNRGRDLRAEWLGTPKNAEVKSTQHCSHSTGYLLVRPPRNTPGLMRLEYIEDCLYVLVVVKASALIIKGWADRDLLIRCGRMNPVPLHQGQRETYGIHWRRLYPMRTWPGTAAGSRDLSI